MRRQSDIDQMYAEVAGSRSFLYPSEIQALRGWATGATPTLEVPRPIRAEPFVWRDPSTIPRRQWLFGRHRARRYVSTTVAPGGTGKTALQVVETLSMVTGRRLVNDHPEGRSRVWLWCGEDPLDEMERRIHAACIHYDIAEGELEGLFVGSGRQTEIVLATMEKSGTKIAHPVVDQLIATIKANAIDAVIIDPFVSSHRVSENDNTAIDAVVKTWARIAEVTDVSVELVHHVRKGQGGPNEYTVEDGRGSTLR